MVSRIPLPGKSSVPMCSYAERQTKRKLVELSKDSMALNCLLLPKAIPMLLGETDTEVRLALVMFKVIVPAGTDPKTARTVTVPGATPVAMPDVLETVATVASEDVHVAEVVRFCVVPSAKVPTAFSCTEVCSASLDPGFGE